jgi:hypothetical protein
MTIQEMHIYFRQYAQQMGMQNVRAIIPEQIDILLNTSISDIVNQLVRDNSGLIKDKATADLSKISQPNALNSLYRIQEINVKELGNFPNPIKTSVSLVAEDYLYITDIAINYITEAGNETRYFPVRIIDAANFAETLNDPILKPKINKPIAVINDDNLEISVNNSIINNHVVIFFNSIILNFKNLRVSYIKKPAIVKYDKENVNSVNCDLPESLHIDIIKHAVELYKTAINDKSSIMYTPQQQPQQPTRQ